ncbi:MAG: GGDEF domain-containing protein [Burkholderiaceae bacterium]|nr:GGDEF domain-containing protein [Roseateles sp.]MBV8471745.1 GGDEF domain-containing protein [Burkholderiaceae bacterium]
MSQPPDLFDGESRALSVAKTIFNDAQADVDRHRNALGELITAYERLLRETRRLVRRSDREELEMNRLNQRLHDLATELEYRATHDSLTGVLNRAAIIGLSNQYLVKDSISLVVLDIDHFKRINDSFGHPIGDRVICGVVDRLQDVVSDSGQIGRVGGEEFTVLLPRMDGDAAAALAERLRMAVVEHDFGLPDGSRVSASFGVSWLPQGGGFDEAYTRADEALYAAKRAGRNQVVRAERLS